MVASIVLSISAFWGCGTPVTVPVLTPADIPHLEAAANFPHHIYRFEPGDTIKISYTFHPEMNQEVVVLPDGKITTHLVGSILVGGLTTTELEKMLVSRTSDQLREPEVIVSVTKFAEKTVYVGGEVEKPGTFEYRKGLSPLQAIVAAGGFRPGAQTDSIILVRAAGPDDKFITRKLNLAEAIADGVQEPIYLAPHDVLYVPRSPIAEANLWVKQHISDLFPFLFPSTNSATGIIRTMRY
jgi:protein involved in polysaccharide export with SLBB domain